MTTEMKLPELGEGVLEGELVKWSVQPGDSFKPDQTICEVMTDKATVEIPSHQSGTVVELLAKEGSMLKVGAPLLSFQAGGSAQANASPKKTEEQKPSSVPSPAARPQMELRKESHAGASDGLTLVSSTGFVRSSPAVRKKAAELGVQLASVRPSGPHNRVLLEDLLSAGTSSSGPANVHGLSKTLSTGKEERIPLRGLRKAIAKQMTLSKYTAPHYAYVEEADFTKLGRLRTYAKELGEKKGIKITYMPFIMKAVLAALREHPLLNASLDEEKQELVKKFYYNIGVAVATPEGLVVPNIKNADQLSIFALAQELQEKAEAARKGKLKSEDMKQGTFTITNIGGIGGLFATPIINYPEVAILGINKIVKRPVIQGKKLVARDMTYLSMSLDHRVVDGAVAAYFMNTLVSYLENPELLLLTEEI